VILGGGSDAPARLLMIGRMQGLHLTADLRGCDRALPLMAELQALRALCLQAVAAAGLRPVGELFHGFPPPGGVTGVVLLAESHLAVHTWPELGAVTLDVYVCNLQGDNGPRAQALLTALEVAFAPGQVEHHRVHRGLMPVEPLEPAEPLAPPKPAAA
jgi:S-adenosylmethionine decarboxylase